MKSSTMKTERVPSAITAASRNGTPAAPRRARAGSEYGPLVHDLQRRAETQMRTRRKDRKSTATLLGSEADSQRLLHELQVHQVELELQNEELRKTRDEMEAGRDKYSDLYDFAPIGYLTLDRDGTISEVNLAGATLLRVARAALAKRRFGVFVSPADRVAFADFLRRVFKSKAREECDVRMLLNAGEAVDVRIRAIVSTAGQVCQLAVSDITAHKQAEDKVRVSEIRYRRLFEAAHDGVLILDPATRKITDANPFMTKLLGYSHAQFVGKELFEIGLLKDEAASQEMFRKLKRTRELRYEDLPLESQCGRHQEVEVVANLYSEDGHAVIQCNIRDITERKQAEVLAVANRKLAAEFVQRRAAATSFKQSEQHQRQLGEQSRQLARELLRTQEEERKRISRELHDVIAQTLTGINIRLAALKKEASLSPGNLDRNIARTQRLVAKSVDIVHQFARELRPAVLDDLGLVPALHAFMESFTTRTGISTSLKAAAKVEQLDPTRRTVLFRVAQEALTNVARHAQASRVEVSLRKWPGSYCIRIADDGKSFDVDRTLNGKGRNRLGLVGMRERLEMVGGCFDVESAPGKGTTIVAHIPRGKVARGGTGGIR